MKHYLAPLEGITGYIYRNAYAQFYGEMDKYFSPFLNPNQHHKFSSKEMNDLLPEHNHKIHLIPQILTNQSDIFIWISKELLDLGYPEINLNLGCPSGTVVSKKRGSGFLAYPEKLNRFLEDIFEHATTKISIKTRIGTDDPEEFYNLINIYNQYPLEELIIHPRLQIDMYRNKPNLAIFKDALRLSKNPICYNGDLFSASDYHSFTAQFPQVDTVMLGRGIIGNPGLLSEILRDAAPDQPRLKQFHDTIVSDYSQVLSGERNLLFKMKELWGYMSPLFVDSESFSKKIKKAQSLAAYHVAVNSLFRSCELKKS